jgi:hypothetical protein
VTYYTYPNGGYTKTTTTEHVYNEEGKIVKTTITETETRTPTYNPTYWGPGIISGGQLSGVGNGTTVINTGGIVNPVTSGKRDSSPGDIV